ncbi:MAG: hypothetical protein GY881_15815 [Gammaproteobacteria bacterium]|nr:hypothetical protein [Gammaproteobacteria bacterium]
MNYGIPLTIGILAGIFAAEFDLDNKCTKSGVYDSKFFSDVRCAPVTHHKTMKSAKEQVLLNQAR